MIRVVISASLMTYAWSSAEPSGCSDVRRKPWVWPAPRMNSTSGRFRASSAPAVPVPAPSDSKAWM